MKYTFYYATTTADPNPNFSCTNNAPFATGNKHAANGVTPLWMSAISCVLNADSGRYTDALISYTA